MENKNYDHLTRQMEIIPVEKLGLPITIIGVGAVGSWATLQLAKMGFCDLSVFDHDIVSIENMNCQFYPFHSIDRPKVFALHMIVNDFTKVMIDCNARKWVPEDGTKTPVIICGVDSMEVRKQIFESCKKSFQVRYFIDTRMASEFMQQWVIDMQDSNAVEAYEKTLFTDKEAVQERCTAKATVYTASLAGSFIAKALKDIITDQPYARAINYDVKRNIPMIWNYGSKSHTTA